MRPRWPRNSLRGPPNCQHQRNSEYGERIEHQSATIDVLKVMSASPGDPQPVFDLIVARARELCGGYGAVLFEVRWHTDPLRREPRASCNMRWLRRRSFTQFPVPPDAWGARLRRAILDRRIIHIADATETRNLDRS